MPRGYRSPFQERRPHGEKYVEYAVFVALAIAAFFIGKWYFVVYKHSPSVALVAYVAAIKSGDTDEQYKMLDAKTRTFYTDKSTYVQKWPMSANLAGKMGDFTVSNMTESGDKAEADVAVSVRKGGDGLLNISSDTYSDHYILKKESDGWKIALSDCYNKIKSQQAGQQR